MTQPGADGAELRIILLNIREERERQIDKWGDQNHKPDLTWLAILSEEVGEVAKGLLEEDSPLHIREELVQVAAVAAAWIEAIDIRGIPATE